MWRTVRRGNSWHIARRLLGPLSWCLALGIASPPLSAQHHDPLAPGRLVRVSHTDGCCRSPSVGTLVFLNADSIVIQEQGPRGARVALRRPRVESVDTRQDIGARTLLGGGLGLIVGAVVGVGYGLASGCKVVDDICIWPLIAAYTGGIGAAAGLLVGAAIGAQIRHVVWLTVPFPGQVGFGPSPSGGAAVRLGVRF